MTVAYILFISLSLSVAVNAISELFLCQLGFQGVVFCIFYTAANGAFRCEKAAGDNLKSTNMYGLLFEK